ncbi:unnamed protein product [Alternaria alternata]
MPQVIDEYISGYDDVEENSTSAAVWGIDYVYLGKTVKDRNASSQYIALTTRKKFHVGTFGLSVGAVGPASATRSSFLSSLWDAKLGFRGIRHIEIRSYNNFVMDHAK